MTLLMRGLLAASRRWWVVGLIIGLNILNFGILFALEARFETLSGVPTFDTQNDLTRTTLLEQLPRYTDEALTAYLWFMAYDFVFPLVAGLMVAVLLTLFLRLNRWGFSQRLLLAGVPVATLLTTVWDWLENVGLLGVLATGGGVFWVEWALLFKRLKLAFLGLSGATVLLAVCLWVGYGVWALARGKRPAR
jgi:hypothetical protein